MTNPQVDGAVSGGGAESFWLRRGLALGRCTQKSTLTGAFGALSGEKCVHRIRLHANRDVNATVFACYRREVRAPGRVHAKGHVNGLVLRC